MTNAAASKRYPNIAIALHWLVLLLVVAAYACILLRENFPRGSDIREGLKTWHFMLGLTVLALMLQAESGSEIFKLGLIWMLVLAASATVCFLIGNEAYRRGQEPWTRRSP